MAYSDYFTNSGSGLVFRISKLYNSDSFSDIEFHVKDGSGFKTFKAHKLIFAAASKEFASRLYNSDDSKIHQILIPDFSPQTFQLTMQYLYTDKLNLTNIQEAFDVYKLSLKYGIKELLENCLHYIEQNTKITMDNVFHMYEMALKEKLEDMLTRCRDLVRTNTKVIFSSLQFREAPVEVLEDILKQDSLAVENELEVIDAVLVWCKQECVRKSRPSDAVSIRKSLSPLLSYLRFLTLSGEEFCNFVEQNCIFSSPETALLTRKILDPDGVCRVPSGFCSNSRPRGTVTENGFRTDTGSPTVSKFNGNVPVHRISLTGKQLSYDKTSQMMKVTCISATNNSQSGFHNMYSGLLLTNTPLVPDPNTTTESQAYLHTYSSPENEVKDENQSKSAMPLFQFGTSAKKPPMLKVMPPAAFNPQKIYDFNLVEGPRAMSSVPTRDLICSAELQVSRGSMVVHGVHLKILNLLHDPNENITVCLSISGDFPEINSISSEKLSNNMIHMQFSEPLKLASSSSAKIQITVEDLKLRRCLVCKMPRWELNSGLNLKAGINLKSNQSNEVDDLFFLISDIIYS